jgi:hypothetical protein
MSLMSVKSRNSNSWVALLSIFVAALVVVAAVVEAMAAAVRNSGVPHYHSMVLFFTIFRWR